VVAGGGEEHAAYQHDPDVRTHQSEHEADILPHLPKRSSEIPLKQQCEYTWLIGGVAAQCRRVSAAALVHAVFAKSAVALGAIIPEAPATTLPADRAATSFTSQGAYGLLLLLGIAGGPAALYSSRFSLPYVG
jgi:hypothetical protein